MVWESPTCQRWWLEGHAGEDRLTLVSESEIDGIPCVIEKPDHYAHPEWLSWACAIGVHLSHNEGAHGWIEWATTRRESPEETKARHERNKNARAQGTLL